MCEEDRLMRLKKREAAFVRLRPTSFRTDSDALWRATRCASVPHERGLSCGTDCPENVVRKRGRGGMVVLPFSLEENEEEEEEKGKSGRGDSLGDEGCEPALR